MKHLKFYHVTKNAGTTIENMGGEEYKWGDYDAEYLQTHGPPICKNETSCYIKHYPLWSYKVNPYPLDKYDVFAVVRNPYSRIVSTFNYLFDAEKKLKFVPKMHERFMEPTPFWLNVFVFLLLFIYLSNDIEYVYSLQPQSYLFRHNKREYVNIILKFENLENEFNELMDRYDIDLKLDHTHRDNVSNKYVSEDDLTFLSRWIINYLFRDDFENFDYTMK
jgi:hypothetical protein